MFTSLQIPFKAIIYLISLLVNIYLFLSIITLSLLLSHDVLYSIHNMKGAIIMKCYIDTVVIYMNINLPVTMIDTYSKWKFHQRKDNNDTHFFNRHRGVTFRYYPCRYGHYQLWAAFSIPKLLHGSNLWNITLGSLNEVYTAVGDALGEVVDINRLPAAFRSVAGWQVSRMDCFILHRIEPRLRQEYLNAYQRLTLGSYVPYSHQNTFYLNSTLKKHRAAGTVVRIYPKLQEMGETSDTIPKDITKDMEYYMGLCDELLDYIRIEFQFRRRTLRYFFNHRKSVTLADVLDEQFQTDRINRMIERLGLHWDIISCRHMRDKLDRLFSKQPTRQRAGRYISLVNSRGASRRAIWNAFTQGQVAYIRHVLHKNHLHTVVSDFEDLEPVKLLK